MFAISSSPIKITTMALNSPNRYVVDFNNAILTKPSHDYKIENSSSIHH
mgnify:CR=1 FL=1